MTSYTIFQISKSCIFSRSYCNTVWSAIGVILSSVCLSVTNVVHCGSQGLYTGLKEKLYQRVPSRHVPICPLRHFCCRMYRLATKCSTKNESKKHVCVLVYIDNYCWPAWPNFVVTLHAWLEWVDLVSAFKNGRMRSDFSVPAAHGPGPVW